jgi:biopolymer transport protein ExbD
MIDFPRPRRSRLTLDMAPLVDVVFLLLVFFILTSSFLPPALPLDLPGSTNEEAAPAEPIVVSLDSAGAIAVNGEIVSRAEFSGKMREALAENENAAVHFRGDRTAEYGWFLQLLDESRQAGAQRLHLVHEAR